MQASTDYSTGFEGRGRQEERRGVGTRAVVRHRGAVVAAAAAGFGVPGAMPMPIPIGPLPALPAEEQGREGDASESGT